MDGEEWIKMVNDIYLVGGQPTPLKNMSQMGLLFPFAWKNKKCSKPPTRNHH
jgi:hypothetical protein